MKAIRYLLILLSVISCESSTQDTYVIENQSDHSIRINFYAHEYGHSRLTKTIELMNKGDDWQETGSTLGGGFDTPIIFLSDVDSAVVTFGEEKRQVWTWQSSDQSRSIFNLNSFEVESSCKRKRVYYSTRKYTFVNNDYENAEPIEGD